MKSKQYPDQQLLRENFIYRKEDGVLIWKKKVSRNVKIGERAGGSHNKGYRVIHINGIKYVEHRIIYIYHYGAIPEGYVVDHIDFNRSNNRIENLQLLKSKINGRKMSLHKNNIMGCHGIYKIKRLKGDGYRSVIRVNDKLITLGTFDTKEEAIAVRKDAEVKYGFETEHGEKADVNKEYIKNPKYANKTKGVTFHTTKNKWMAGITYKGLKTHLGYFTTEDEAILARKEAEQKLYST